MKISGFEVEQRATSSFTRVEKSEVNIQAFRVNTQPVVEGSAIAISLSEESMRLKEAETEDLFHLSEEDKAKIRLLEEFVSAIMGKRFKFKQVVKLEESEKKSELPQLQSHVPLRRSAGEHAQQIINPQAERGANPQGQLGIRISTKHEVSETEMMSFQSKGVVNTSDGRTIDFKVNVQMERAHYESSSTLIELGAKMQDPLVINLDGKGVAFGEDSIELDITLDGEKDVFRNLAEGSGFLAFDENQNGTIDDGSELFGAKTGNGFDELALHDGDANCWIDENDAIFKSLKIWTVSASGEKNLIGLKESDVGAIYLGKVASQFHVKEGMELIGRIRESSVYLKESGGAGVVHEIDLKI